MKQIILNAKITGTGSYVPEKIYTNKMLESMTDTSDEWIYENLGIRERHIVSPGQCTSDLAIQAGVRAIDNAGLSPNDIDMIIVATATPDRKAPATACIVQHGLKAYNAVCFDINAVCSGFLYGMAIAGQLNDNWHNLSDKNTLVIGADTFSKITDWQRRDCVFFGDGAGAAIISTSYLTRDEYMSFHLYSDGRGKDCFTVSPGEQYFKMDARAVYDKATTVLPEAINQILHDAQMTISDIDYLIPHQAGIKVLKKTAELIGLPFERVLTNMDKYGNTSGGTIPILLDEAWRTGILKDKTVLFAAIGSGWTWGAGIVNF
jgi:3-oxoacyl-[acyl-carrier-protein] synthase-3